MVCPSGHIVRGKLVFQSGGRLVRLLRNAQTYRAPGHRAFASCSCQHTSHTSRNCRQSQASPRLGDRRPSRWACRLSTSCQAAASSPHAAVVEKAEAKASKQQGQLVPLPTTDESPELDRIRHSVSSDLLAAIVVAVHYCRHLPKTHLYSTYIAYHHEPVEPIWHTYLPDLKSVRRV